MVDGAFANFLSPSRAMQSYALRCAQMVNSGRILADIGHPRNESFAVQHSA